MQVEVVGPAGRRWLSLPAAEPVGDLLPPLVRLLGAGAGPAGGDGWALAPPVGRPVASEASLREAGILPGSTLCLVASRLAEDADGVLPPRALVGMRTPLERTAAALPRRLTAWARARAALELARARGAEAAPAPASPALAAPGTSLHPATFTEVRAEPLWRRAWRAWHELDYLARLEAAVVAPRLRRCVTVAVASAIPGTGRTVVASLLGTLLADLRRDRVVAFDPDPGDRSLVALAAPGLARYLDALLGRPTEPAATLTGMDANLLLGYHGLRVHCAPPNPELRGRWDEAAHEETLGRLARVAGVLVVDCGPGIDGAAVRAAVQAADQVLLVTDAGPRARAALGPAVDRLRGPARSVLVVANAPRSPARPADAGRVAVCSAGAQGLVSLPWSPAGAAQLASGRFEWRHAPRDWRRATLELAAAMAADWGRLGLSA